jgi:hypothetical protein
MSHFHPTRRFAGVIPIGGCRQYNGHPAAAPMDRPKLTLTGFHDLAGGSAEKRIKIIGRALGSATQLSSGSPG